MAAYVVRLDKPIAGTKDSQPVIDLQLDGDQGVLQYTRALLHHVADGERKTCLRAAWRALCFCDPPRSLGLAIGVQLVLLISMSHVGELGVTHIAVENFLKAIDEEFGCVSRLTDDDSDADAVVSVIRRLRKSVTEIAKSEASSDADVDADSDEDADASAADDGDDGADETHADDAGEY